MDITDRAPFPVPAALAATVVGVALTLVAQFALDGFADSGQLGHWLQHGLLFGGGILAGAGGLALYAGGGRSI